MLTLAIVVFVLVSVSQVRRHLSPWEENTAATSARTSAHDGAHGAKATTDVFFSIHEAATSLQQRKPERQLTETTFV